jgi:DNA-binding NarL/FixJ family response regulator
MADKNRILVVDDEPVIVEQLTESLEDMGFGIAGRAGTAQEAVAKARKLNPDLVIMDIVMPGDMDGIDACKIVQRELDIPVLLLSAHGEESMIDRADAVRPYGYVMKPFKNDQLRAAVQLAMGQKRSEGNRPALILSQQHIKLMQDISAFAGMERYHGLMPERHAVIYDDEVIRDLVDNNLVDEGVLTTTCGMETKGFKLTDTAKDELERLGLDLDDEGWDDIKDLVYVTDDDLTKEDIELLTEVYHFTKIKRYHGIAPRDMLEECDKKRVKDLYKSGYLFNIRLKGPSVKHEKGYVLTDRGHSLLKHIGVIK